MKELIFRQAVQGMNLSYPRIFYKGYATDRYLRGYPHGEIAIHRDNLFTPFKLIIRIKQ